MGFGIGRRRLGGGVRVAILSGGPSVLETWPRENPLEWDITVGISTACWVLEADWMAYMDLMSAKTMAGMGRSPSDGAVSVLGRPDWGWGVEQDRFPPFSSGRIAPFTLPNAVNWALSRFRPGRLAIFGDDRDGRANVGGHGANHGPERWIEEEMWMDLAVRDARKAGISCKLERIRPISVKSGEYSPIRPST